MSIHEVERREVAGIPAYVADVPGPFTAALAVRVGRADEFDDVVPRRMADEIRDLVVARIGA
jgi:hypothetical protein